MPTELFDLAVIGAGPTGLDAALAALDEGLDVVVLEAAPSVAASVRDWGHVRLFTPWAINASHRMRRHLNAAGSAVPADTDSATRPTGAELAEQLLEPVAALPVLAGRIRTGTRVTAVGREGLLKHEHIADADRAARPFRLAVHGDGGDDVVRARAVLDCSGGYAVPNALGDAGIPARGELGLADRIDRRLPDLAADQGYWSGRTTLLVGAGYSAQTAAGDLAVLADGAPGTAVVWAIRETEPAFGAVADDPLPARAALSDRAMALATGAHPAVTARTGVTVEAVAERNDRLVVTLRGDDGTLDDVEVDRILALTGTLGDQSIYRQLQVHECYATLGPITLSGALLGAAAGDCMTQPAQGVDVLRNPEPGFYVLGNKSYGRNNQYLLRVGYEQVDVVLPDVAATLGRLPEPAPA
ncbi:MAG: FAD-dependent oxidoreductase [Acidimicrobiales bacterium]